MPPFPALCSTSVLPAFCNLKYPHAFPLQPLLFVNAHSPSFLHALVLHVLSSNFPYTMVDFAFGNITVASRKLDPELSVFSQRLVHTLWCFRVHAAFSLFLTGQVWLLEWELCHPSFDSASCRPAGFPFNTNKLAKLAALHSIVRLLNTLMQLSLSLGIEFIAAK